ncbi:hypothetical protein SAMN05421678_113157 [Actinopolymorpha cephalotaxi]|uniref:Fatty acid desaturase n=1 Tax=Actinopolymorpha cephalotaxi TaxID=504797 RepID=A0A1I2Y2T1_9ACTN|nr:hypothetical protein [Actinopolymorpha cephalotaxi]NYH87277.1 fatty acid desaturase [Actinopolymorpha cephalotaxi]SFH19256.1 hypothetical protein SAMN05421678_113157 [Actinopolymorpha cephalotaxi]
MTHHDSRLSSGHSTLRPLGPPLPASKKGYHWAAVLVGIVLLAAMGLIAFGFFSVPGVDLVRAGGWTFAISLLIVIPAAVVVLLLSWAVVWGIRRLGARRWPGLVQALPAVLLILFLLYLLSSWLFAPPPE